MIAAIKIPTSDNTKPANHAAFLAMLPAIRRTAQITFRKIRPELRDELIEEVVANCYVAYARLVDRGHADRALPSPLARFAIAQEQRVSGPIRERAHSLDRHAFGDIPDGQDAAGRTTGRLPEAPCDAPHAPRSPQGRE